MVIVSAKQAGQETFVMYRVPQPTGVLIVIDFAHVETGQCATDLPVCVTVEMVGRVIIVTLNAHLVSLGQTVSSFVHVRMVHVVLDLMVRAIVVEGGWEQTAMNRARRGYSGKTAEILAAVRMARFVAGLTARVRV